MFDIRTKRLFQQVKGCLFKLKSSSDLQPASRLLLEPLRTSSRSSPFLVLATSSNRKGSIIPQKKRRGMENLPPDHGYQLQPHHSTPQAPSNEAARHGAPSCFANLSRNRTGRAGMRIPSSAPPAVLSRSRQVGSPKTRLRRLWPIGQSNHALGCLVLAPGGINTFADMVTQDRLRRVNGLSDPRGRRAPCACRLSPAGACARLCT
ncbi:hypothetical protein B0T17DRAFT_153762 [Bombardia bombarda]|uniref:Uncharacterized protein n=1 Tax=Bombardia bombarda TaxID=252184 RepID=A0AA39X6Y8_9PEZI|nr:hypothetical protein B0T17DRAFT_153762 [Bombardia bombarda]